MENLSCTDDINKLKGVGDKTAATLNKRGFFKIRDILYYLPIKYEDKRSVKRISEIKPGFVGWIKGKVKKTRLFFTKHKRMFIVTLYLFDKNKTAKAVFFNQKYLAQYFKKNEWVSLYGKTEPERQKNIHFKIIPSKFDKHKKEPENVILPVYERISRLTSKRIRKLIKQILINKIRENLPEFILKKYKLPSRYKSLKNIHFPENNLPTLKNRYVKRLIFEELFYFQLSLAYLRNKYKRIVKKRKYNSNKSFINIIEKKENIKLTSDQKKAVNEIVRDFNKKYPMKRLLQGDVGSGKTMVSIFTAYYIITSGYQVAFMAPTEILASQHAQRLKQMKSFQNFKIELLLGSMPQKKSNKIREKIKSGEIDFIIGTHSLFQEKVKYKKLGYVIIDEQHRFGVAQRTALSLKGKAVDLLVMTATPIPRSLYLTLYSDLDVSIIKEKPFGKQKIKTYILNREKRDDAILWIYKQTKKGHQGFIVFPLIEESEKLNLRNLETELEKIKSNYSDISIGILHGKMKSSEKEKIRREFEQKKVMLLLTTSIIEVGLDVPSASFILIEHPERYGLSQLHQMRGRVGRRNEEGYCFLVHSSKTGIQAKKRMKILKNCSDGFQISEHDLKLRGSGNPVGKQQWGNLDFLIANPIRDIDILTHAKKEAYSIIENKNYSDKIEYYFEKLNKLSKEIDFN